MKSEDFNKDLLSVGNVSHPKFDDNGDEWAVVPFTYDGVQYNALIVLENRVWILKRILHDKKECPCNFKTEDCDLFNDISEKILTEIIKKNKIKLLVDKKEKQERIYVLADWMKQLLSSSNGSD